MTRGVKDRGEDSLKRHQDNIKISFAPQMNAKQFLLRVQVIRVDVIPLTLKGIHEGQGLKIWLQSKVEVWDDFCTEQTHEPSWLITYVM